MLWAGLARYRPLWVRKLLFGLERDIGAKVLCHLGLIITKFGFGAAPRSMFLESTTQRTRRVTAVVILILRHEQTP